MLDYKLIEALATVIETGSFEGAARRLHLTQSAVSQRLKLLEARVGRPLLVRSSPVRATPDGHLYLKHYRKVLLLESELETISDEERADAVILPVAVNVDSMDSWFLPALSPSAIERGWLLNLMVEDQEETLRLLKQGDVIGCVTAEPHPPQGCRSFALGAMRYRCVATPGFVERFFAAGPDPESLLQAPVVTFNSKDRLHDEFLNRFAGTVPARYPRHLLPSTRAFVDAVRSGLGYGLVPEQMLAGMLERGELMDIDPGQPFTVELYWQCWGVDTPLIRELSDIVIGAGRRALLQSAVSQS